MQKGETVSYRALPIYTDASPIPIGVTLSARGAGGFTLDVSIPNVIGLKFIYEASKGFGFSVGGGYFYSLDQDWDDPEEFNEVSFFLGEVGTSSIPVFDYVFLMKIAADVYSEFFPEERGGVLNSAKRLEERYSKKSPV